MPRHLPPTVQSALSALDSARWRPLPFAAGLVCPVCGSPISQSATGENHILRHFSCPSCGFWSNLRDEDLRTAILASAASGDEEYISGSGFGGAWYNPVVGELSLYCRLRDRIHLRGYALDSELRAIQMGAI